jgi:Ser/Thr protein kinase RdoA (MazF antagonist)
MSRRLSVSRARVNAADEAGYLAVLGDLAGRLASHGESLWLFRHPEQRDTYLEFSESDSAERHRSRAARTPEEAALEVRLRALASYASDAWVLWEEVPLKKS